MSERETTKTNLKDINSSLSSGEEPTELLLAVAWSAIETLAKRGKVKIYVGRNAVAVFFHNVRLDEQRGLAPTLPTEERK
jgi:hypothetical protein